MNRSPGQQPVCDEFFADIAPPSGYSSQYLNPFVRSYIGEAREYLLRLHDAGESARRVNQEHAELVDRLVRKLFRLIEDRYFEQSPRLSNFRIAIVAVGGYGRRELSLASDVDLVFLHRGKVNPYVETIAEGVSQRLWDGDLVVGAATRTLADCLRVGREDLPTMTSYLDARFLIGDPGLFAELERSVREEIKECSRSFIAGKLEEQRSRHERYGESLYLLQPNLKESVGGLRDYHTALWVARAVQQDVRRAEHLHVHGFIDATELEELLEALDFLWRLRNQLHRRGRKDDMLHFGAQEALAGHLGYASTERSLAVEDLMRSYYLHARTIERISQRTVDHALRISARRTTRDQRHPPQAVAEGFAIVDGRLEVPAASLFAERPVRLLAVFAVAQHHDVELSSRALRQVQQNVHLVDDDLRNDPDACELFRSILNAPARVYRTLRMMNEVELLSAWIPEFAHLWGLWQQDMYHTYTVDIHSLFLVEQLRRIHKGLYRDELPLATELVREVRRPFVLYLSCILHDIGKGRGGGHSAKGAALIPAIGKRLGLDDREIDMVQFLVLHHLTKSSMAEQRDVNDSRLIQKLANLCKTRQHLRNLYLITVADIRSVSREAWTTWKDGLLRDLYRNTAEWFEAVGKEEASTFFLERAMQRAHDTQESALAQLESEGVDSALVRTVLDRLPRHYLLMHNPHEVEAHVRALLSYAAGERPVGVYSFRPREDEAPYWGVVVLAPDRSGLFQGVAGVLASCGLDILAAHVYTTREHLALEAYQLGPVPAGPEEEEVECERIAERLERWLARGELPRRGTRPVPGPGVAALRTQPPTVNVTNDDSDFYTIVDVSSNDRPALLHDITRTLSSLGLEISMSRASTRAQRATDAFYVTLEGRKVMGDEQVARIEASLLEALAEDPSGPAEAVAAREVS